MIVERRSTGTEAGQSSGSGPESTSVVEAIGLMPYDFSPARLRCMELAEELAADESSFPSHPIYCTGSRQSCSSRTIRAFGPADTLGM